MLYVLFEVYDGGKLIVILKLFYSGKFFCNLLMVVLGIFGLVENVMENYEICVIFDSVSNFI